MLLLLALGKVALVVGVLRMMLGLLLALREAAFVRGFGTLLTRSEVPFFLFAFRVMLDVSSPVAKEP